MSRTYCHQKCQRQRRLEKEIRQRCIAGDVAAAWTWNLALMPASIRALRQEWFDLEPRRQRSWQTEAMRRNSVRHAMSKLIWLERKRGRNRRKREAGHLIDEQLHADGLFFDLKGICHENTG